MIAIMAKPKVQIKQFNQEQPGFWDLMGRYFASAQVQKDLGIPMVSDETHTWFVAVQGDQVLGFAALVPSKKAAQIRRDYVLPEYRDSDLHRQLLAAAIASDMAKGRPILGSANPTQVATYKSLGFVEDATVGQYKRMLLTPAKE